MATKRVTEEELKQILTKKGYGLNYSIGGGIGKGSIASSLGDSGEDEDVEPASGDASLRSEALSLNYSGRCIVRIKFYRRRLADYSRAISEKAIIDALVYGGALRDDSEKEICLIDEGQVKVETDAEERTEINLEYTEVDLDNLFVPREKFGNSGTK